MGHLYTTGAGVFGNSQDLVEMLLRQMPLTDPGAGCCRTAKAVGILVAYGMGDQPSHDTELLDFRLIIACRRQIERIYRQSVTGLEPDQ